MSVLIKDLGNILIMVSLVPREQPVKRGVCIIEVFVLIKDLGNISFFFYFWTKRVVCKERCPYYRGSDCLSVSIFGTKSCLLREVSVVKR